MKNRLSGWLFLVGGALLSACGASDEAPGDEVGEVSEALAPAGSNAQFVSASANFLTNFAPGERRVVSVTMRNTGTNAATNVWTPTNPQYSLFTKGSPWGWSFTPVSANTPINTNTGFTFVVTAPTTTQPFVAQMKAHPDFFGPIVTLNPAVVPGTQPEWGCTYVPAQSNLPSTMAPGESRVVTLVVRNTGTKVWTPATDFGLAPKDVPISFWNSGTNFITAPISPGNIASFKIAIKAPTTPGTYSFNREMKSFRQGPGDFRLSGFCISRNIVVDAGISLPLNSQVVSATFTTPINTNSTGTGTVTMKNTGTETWSAGTANFVLYSVNNPLNLWGLNTVGTPTSTPPGGEVTYSFLFRAPATAGTYTQAWQMRKLTGTNPGFFGAATNVAVTVNAGPANYDAAVVSQVIPTRMTIGKPYQFQITTRNTGELAWTGNRIGLYTQNSPANLWGITNVNLGASESIPVNGTRLFTINVIPPATPGTYSSRWQMRSLDNGHFGALAQTDGIIVTRCGNNVLDVGEECDDNNLTNGDGCTESCVQEQDVYDPATTAMARTILGSGGGMAAGPIVFGDVTGDGVPEVFSSEVQPPLAFRTGRVGGGGVYGFPGGAGFFTGTTTTNPAGATLQIAGADADDQLGANGTARVVIAEVTGDSIADLIVSAPGGDGASNARTNAGEVYVFAGGASLMSAGTIDLRTSTLPVAHIVGAAGEAISVVAVGDLTGDGKGELIVGSPVGAGKLYILQGGAALTGEIDLTGALPSGVTFTTVTGAADGDIIGGTSIAIGDINGDSSNDLLVGSPLSAPGGKTRAGAAYAKFGPITADVAFAGAVGSAGGPSTVWLGRNAFEGLGQTVAIGNVITSTPGAEALIGGIQYERNGSGPQGGGIHIWSGVTSTTYDEVTATPTATITGARQGDNCGTSLKLGDVNADGTLDIVFGCSTANGPGQTRIKAGEINVIFGGATLPANWDLLNVKSRIILYGDAANTQIGRYLPTLTVADMDGDGAADFCGGAPIAGGSGRGRIDCVRSPY